MMMKFFWSLVERREGRPAWETDPLRHPEIAVMDQRELGDLPMVPVVRERSVQGLVACITTSATYGVVTRAA